MPNVPINLFGMLGDIGSDLGGAIGHARQRDTLTGLGSLIQGGDYAGAATKAFASGDLNTGLKLLTLGQQQDELKRQRAADAQVFGLLGGGEPAQSPSVNIQPRASIGASPSTGGGAATPKNLGGLTGILEDELIKQGVPKENARAGAAALAGQVVQESTINPRAVHDGGTGYGIYGARLDRRDKMFDWLSRNGYPRDSLEGQARYMVNEALTDYPRTAQAIRAANGGNLSDVTRVVMEDFERPRAGPGAGLPNRVQAAGAAYRTGGGAPVQVAAADNFTPQMGGQAAPSPGVQVAQAAPQTGGDALEARWNNLNRALATPNLSENARRAIQAEAQRVEFQIRQRDTKQARDDAMEERRFNAHQAAADRHANRKLSTAEVNAEREAEADRLGITGEDRLHYITSGKIQTQAEKPQTDAQANAALYATRMAEADKLISDSAIYESGLGARGAAQEAASKIPIVGNAMLTSKFQQYDQAKRNFINAVLRKESGAVISDSEFANAEKQYFPKFGDSPEVIAQKAANRRTAIEGISNAAGQKFLKQKHEQALGGGPAAIAEPPKTTPGGVTKSGVKWSIEP